MFILKRFVPNFPKFLIVSFLSLIYFLWFHFPFHALFIHASIWSHFCLRSSIVLPCAISFCLLSRYFPLPPFCFHLYSLHLHPWTFLSRNRILPFPPFFILKLYLSNFIHLKDIFLLLCPSFRSSISSFSTFSLPFRHVHEILIKSKLKLLKIIYYR